MRVLLFSSLILLSFIVIGQNNTALIKGKITGNIPEKINYTAPVGDSYFWNYSNSFQPDSLGNFAITINTARPCFVNIYYADESHSIIVEPNGEYEININQNQVNINGSTDGAQNFYTNLLRINPRACDNPISTDTSTVDIIKLKLDESLAKELSDLLNIYSSGSISKDVYELVKFDREVYYKIALANLASKNLLVTQNGKEVVSSEMMKLWVDAVSSISLTNLNFLHSTYAYDFLDIYIWCQIYTHQNIDEFNSVRKEFRQKNLVHTHTLSLARMYLQGDLLEFYKAAYLHLNSFRATKELLSLFESFIVEYPNSNYTPYLKPKMSTIGEKLKLQDME
ncbi:MAG TPA: hypothetical protein PLH91_05905 [Tenuifilaceae bacterium]|nr:hypothetical protein [Tenuifilaceae bacterium]HOZ13891.1 hypothetical protein [Tenuifilaceae bacterium]HPI44744.1 hypothetical protein [Tenuifilaceae bacterium]HPN20613.1 hypothetical protein [Tenuifilaceae bacterium]